MGASLYHDSPYLEAWEAGVREVTREGDRYHVVLSETAFYPEGGGQPSDRGTIDGIAVEGVYERDGTIYHVLATAPANSVVACRLDFARRFDHMQQHTGQHLLSAIIERLYGAGTSSFHLGEYEASIDVHLREVSPQMIRAIEDAVYDHLSRDLPVNTYRVTPAEAVRFPGIRPPSGSDTVRVVEIESVEFNACCGTHVGRLGEIGLVKITKIEKMGGGQTRIYFKCGKRALRDYQLKHEITSALSRQYKVVEGELTSRIEAQAGQLKGARKEIEWLKEQLLDMEAAEMARSATSHVIRKAYEDRPFEELSFLAKHVLRNGDFVLILSSLPDRRLLLACGRDSDVDCGKLFRERLPAFNGRGGGSANFATAAFGGLDDLRRFETYLAQAVRGQ